MLFINNHHYTATIDDLSIDDSSFGFYFSLEFGPTRFRKFRHQLADRCPPTVDLRPMKCYGT
jgi:hypothetical protein